MKPQPFVSIIIVNYNGAHFLPACLGAIQKQTYPQACFEVIVADNASTDNTHELLRTEYPWVRLQQNPRNLGFSGGNNAAIAIAKGEFIILLNNDTAPQEQWLQAFVQAAQHHPKAGLLSGKLVFFYDELKLNLVSESKMPANDQRQLGVQLLGVHTHLAHGVTQYLSGFYGWETNTQQRWRWTNGDALLGVSVPMHTMQAAHQITLDIAAPWAQTPITLRVYANETLLGEFVVHQNSVTSCQINIPAVVLKQAKTLIQNAGSIVFNNGSGRDRGTYVRQAEAFFEEDNQQYAQPEQVFAACGGNMLMRKTLLEDVGSLDDDFFMYYEDTDLSWRALLKGWEIWYVPDATARHIHSGSSKEWSPLFTFHVERNRLALLIKNASAKIAWRECFFYGLSLAQATIKIFKSLIYKVPNWQLQTQSLSIKYRAAISLITWLPKLLKHRRHIQQTNLVSKKEIESRLVQP